ncbi:MAG: hypothetical protein JWR35_3455 [Marmoricola sp.]|jgi:hypothetical protein|nr:hypothetical protein [Marmoricola sp.]
MNKLWAPLGLVLIIVGAVWAAQGFNWLTGSQMSGKTLWAVVGPVVMVVGLGCVVRGVAKR